MSEEDLRSEMQSGKDGGGDKVRERVWEKGEKRGGGEKKDGIKGREVMRKGKRRVRKKVMKGIKEKEKVKKIEQ